MLPAWQEKEKMELSRRQFLGLGIATAASVFGYLKSVEFLTVLSTYGEAELRYYNFIHDSGDISNYSFTNKQTFYDDSSLQQTRVVNLGDSIALGWVGINYPFYPASKVVVDTVNAKLHGEWTYSPYAKDAAKTADIQRQINDFARDVKQIKPSQNQLPIDVNMSAGGNNLAFLLENPKIQHIIQNLNQTGMTPNKAKQLVVLFDEIDNTINTYQGVFAGMLESILALQKPNSPYSINRIFVQSVPDIGKAQYIGYNDPNGRPVEFDISKSQELQTIATAISQKLNLAMAKAIASALKSTKIDIILENNFSLITPNLFEGFHPNKDGQQLIADQRMRRSIIQDKKTSIYQATMAM